MPGKKPLLLFFDLAGMREIKKPQVVKECAVIKTAACLQWLSRISDHEINGNNYSAR